MDYYLINWPLKQRYVIFSKTPLRILMKLSENVCLSQPVQNQVRNPSAQKFLFISVSCLFTKHVCGPSFVPVQDTVMLGLSTRSSLLAGHSILQNFFSRPAICLLKVTNVNKKIIRHFHTPSIFTIRNCGGLKIFLVIGNFKKLDQ